MKVFLALGPAGGFTTRQRYLDLATIYLRLALGAGFLSAVADRFGWWGPAGTTNVAWGNFHNFLAYTAKLNPWFPAGAIPAVGVIATAFEIAVGIALIVGFRTRVTAVVSGLLTLAFAIGMTAASSVHAPLNASVFAASAGSFLLAGAGRFPLSLDRWRKQDHPENQGELTPPQGVNE